MSQFSLSVCICTRDRPDELRACLASVDASGVPAGQVIVSDDGDPSSGAAEISEAFGAEYLRGPRTGLCANRNNALSRVTGSHVLFLDDDAELAEDFVARVRARLDSEPDAAIRRRMIVSGRERRPNGHVTEAREQSFLGFQEAKYAAGVERKTVVINAAVFPVEIFRRMSFDERIVYGYDEVDLTTRAVAAGWRIVALPEAVNAHNHSPRSRQGYAEGRDAARLFVTLKRYGRTDNAPLKAAAFALIAPPHLVLATLRRSGPRAAIRSLRALALALALIGDWSRSGDIAPVLAPVAADS